jgi:hypothetical protein
MRSYLLLALLITLNVNAIKQEEPHLRMPSKPCKMKNYEAPAWCDGFIVLDSGDTISGKIAQEGFAGNFGIAYQYEYMTFVSAQTCVMKFKPYGLRCFQYFPTYGPQIVDSTEIKSLKLWSKVYQYPYNDHAPYDYFISINNNIDQDNDEGKIFAQELKIGKCSVYGFEKHSVFSGADNSQGVRYEDKCFLSKANGSRDMENYFKDCSVLMARIESDQYNYKNWPEMVTFYNDSCTSGTQPGRP